jgi:hypothetical protein
MMAAGTAAAPIDHRHGIDSDAPTMVAMTMPTPISRRRQFGDVHRGGLRRAADREAQDEPPDRQQHRVGGERTPECADDEDDREHDQCPLAAALIRKVAARKSSDHGAKQDAPCDHLLPRLGDAEVLGDLQKGA